MGSGALGTARALPQRRTTSPEIDTSTGSWAFARLDALARTWYEVLPTDSVRDQAMRLPRVHPFRGAEALQLAAAVAAAEHQPRTLPIITLYHRLREGFAVLPAAIAG